MEPLYQVNLTKKQQNKDLKTAARYSGLAFQMLAIILAGVFGGIKLDQWIHTEFPIFTLILTIVSVILSVYYAIKDLIDINK